MARVPDWKTQTTGNIPELLERADYGMDTPMSLWMSISALLSRAVESKNTDLVKRIANEFKHYLDFQGDSDEELDYYTAVVVGFMENIIRVDGIEKYIRYFFDRNEFIEFRAPLTHLGRSKKYFQIMEKVYN